MSRRATGLAALLAAVLLGAGGSAAADTLNNGGSPLAIVIPNGTTFTMTSTAGGLSFTGGSLFDRCASGTLAGRVVDNGRTGNPIRLSLTAATFTACTYPTSMGGLLPWTIEIAQGGPPYVTSGGLNHLQIDYGGGCEFDGPPGLSWADGTPSTISFAGSTWWTLDRNPCPGSIVANGTYAFTSVSAGLSNNMQIN